MALLTGKPTISRALLGAAFLSLAVAGIHAIFWVLLPRGVLGRDWFSVDIQVTLIAFEIAMTSIVLVAASLLGAAGSRFLPRWAVLSLALVLLWCLAIFLLASWLFFAATGDFLGVEALVMWWRNFGLMGQHVVHFVPMLSIVLPLVALGAALLMLTGLAFLRRMGEERALSLAGPAWLVLLFVLIMAIVWPGLRLPDGLRDSYSNTKWQSTGPTTYLLGSVAGAIAGEHVSAVPGWADQFLKRPVREPLDEYIERVNSSQLNRHNVILLLVESLRPDALTTFEGNRMVMPTIERLSAGGKRFTQAYAQATHSNYSDLVPLSSQYPLRSTDAYMYPHEYTYPRILIYDILKRMGWRTAIFSSQDERWGGMLNYLKTGGLDRLLHAENYEGTTYVPRVNDWLSNWMMGEKRAGKIDDRYTVAEATQWVSGLDGRPFFIYLNLQSSHLPFEIPSDFDAPFDMPEKVTGVSFEDSALRVFSDEGLSREEFSEAMRIRYLNSLSYLDSQLSRLIEELRAQDELENTVFVISGDTGFAFYEHDVFGYGSIPWNEVVRVPLIVSGPGLTPGDDAGVAEHVDIPSTILSLLGFPDYPGFQGEDLTETPQEKRSPAFILTQTPITNAMGVVMGKWKYIYDMENRHAMLFNLAEDPGETQNLVRQHPEQFYRLDTLLALWRRAQIDYYRDIGRHTREFPPRLLPGFSLEELGQANREAQ